MQPANQYRSPSLFYPQGFPKPLCSRLYLKPARNWRLFPKMKSKSNQTWLALAQWQLPIPHWSHISMTCFENFLISQKAEKNQTNKPTKPVALHTHAWTCALLILWNVWRGAAGRNNTPHAQPLKQVYQIRHLAFKIGCLFAMRSFVSEWILISLR